MTSNLNLLEKEAEFEEQKELEIAAIAKNRNVSKEDAAQLWEDESQEDF